MTLAAAYMNVLSRQRKEMLVFHPLQYLSLRAEYIVLLGEGSSGYGNFWLIHVWSKIFSQIKLCHERLPQNCQAAGSNNGLNILSLVATVTFLEGI